MRFILGTLGAAGLMLLVTTAANAASTPTPTSPERMEQLKLQVALDRANFRPGKIDGLGGEFTQAALERYKASNGHDPGKKEDLRDYTIEDADLAWVGPQAKTPAEQEKLKGLLYADLWELVAEKFHCDQKYLHDLNPTVGDLKAGVVLRVPDVQPFLLSEVDQASKDQIAETKAKKEAAKSKDKSSEEASPTPSATPSQYHVVLLRGKRLVEVYEGDRLAASFPCTPGSSEHPVEPGTMKVNSITPLPYFRWDQSVLDTGKRSDNAFNLPPGPRNPVGIVWIALNRPSIGMHGTTAPDQIGRNESHGCIRLANWDANDLRKLLSVGTEVVVQE